MNVKPLFDRVIIEEEQEKTTQTGIFLGTANKENPKQGTILYVGEGNDLDDGKKSEMHVKVGDKVLFNKFAGVETEINKKQVYIVRQTDILAIIE